MVAYQDTEHFTSVEREGIGAVPPRREFLVKAATMLGYSVCASTVISLVNACESTSTRNQPSTMTNPTNPTNPTMPGGTAANTVNIATEAQLQTVGGAVIRTINNNQVVIIRSAPAAFLVFSAICTHDGCPVNLPMNGTMFCPCHGSRFSATDGSVVNGPAQTALRRFNATFDAMTNILTIMF
jgi:Rieske Fe-S protein